mmetsp:Transcript_72799/g.120545  ORF Transcript_72799/g.120545 Transcript_72799/m.120545 type:complete len:111 (-) Transcript_72799:1072-1404(-)
MIDALRLGRSRKFAERADHMYTRIEFFAFGSSNRRESRLNALQFVSSKQCEDDEPSIHSRLNMHLVLICTDLLGRGNFPSIHGNCLEIMSHKISFQSRQTGLPSHNDIHT